MAKRADALVAKNPPEPCRTHTPVVPFAVERCRMVQPASGHSGEVFPSISSRANRLSTPLASSQPDIPGQDGFSHRPHACLAPRYPSIAVMAQPSSPSPTIRATLVRYGRVSITSTKASRRRSIP